MQCFETILETDSSSHALDPRGISSKLVGSRAVEGQVDHDLYKMFAMLAQLKEGGIRHRSTSQIDMFKQ